MRHLPACLLLIALALPLALPVAASAEEPVKTESFGAALTLEKATPLAEVLAALEEQIAVRLDMGDRRVSPFLVPMMMPNAPGAAVSMRFGLQGPNETITTACAAGTHAIFDVGGDDVGARALGSLRCALGDAPYELWQVINACRPFTNTIGGCVNVQASIENAAQKNRVKIGAIQDFTTERVEIELSLPRGVYADEVIPQLWAYTDCEVSLSSSLLVIRAEDEASVAMVRATHEELALGDYFRGATN